MAPAYLTVVEKERKEAADRKAQVDKENQRRTDQLKKVEQARADKLKNDAILKKIADQNAKVIKKANAKEAREAKAAKEIEDAKEAEAAKAAKDAEAAGAAKAATDDEDKMEVQPTGDGGAAATTQEEAETALTTLTAIAGGVDPAIVTEYVAMSDEEKAERLRQLGGVGFGFGNKLEFHSSSTIDQNEVDGEDDVFEQEMLKQAKKTEEAERKRWEQDEKEREL